jgi:hypothetical protein
MLSRRGGERASSPMPKLTFEKLLKLLFLPTKEEKRQCEHSSQGMQAG